LFWSRCCCFLLVVWREMDGRRGLRSGQVGGRLENVVVRRDPGICLRERECCSQEKVRKRKGQGCASRMNEPGAPSTCRWLVLRFGSPLPTALRGDQWLCQRLWGTCTLCVCPSLSGSQRLACRRGPARQLVAPELTDGMGDGSMAEQMAGSGRKSESARICSKAEWAVNRMEQRPRYKYEAH